MLTRDAASFDLARQLREPPGAPIGEVFAFLSGLYFRGKLAYARAFPHAGAFVITPCLGLASLDERVTTRTLAEFAQIDIGKEDERFRLPLYRDARGLFDATAGMAEVVLLGSVASKKYVEILGDVFGERLLFPIDFVGRGDMSRGGLMLRAARAGVELPYAPVLSTTRKGKRPPKLSPSR